MTAPAVARVSALWVFPVKSMAGTTLDVAGVATGGLAGDRGWAVVDELGETVTARSQPRLREVATRLLDGEVRLDVPGAQAGLAPDAAAEALSAFLGRPVRLAHREGAGFVDVAPVHLVSTAAITDAAHAVECDACEITQPRANLVLDLGQGAGSERDWVGRRLVSGDVSLHVVRVPKHCLGVYADVVTTGELRRGDEVTLA
jgi:uncharacterized protein YcbX